MLSAQVGLDQHLLYVAQALCNCCIIGRMGVEARNSARSTGGARGHAYRPRRPVGARYINCLTMHPFWSSKRT